MAVFTQLTKDQIESVIMKYDCGELVDFVGVEAGSENTTYICNTTSGKYVLTLFEARGNPAHINPQIKFINDLYKEGIPVPQILAQESGNVLCELNGKYVLLQTFLLGDKLESPTAEQCNEAGKALAKIHILGEKKPTGITNTLGSNELKAIAEEIQTKQNSGELTEVLGFLESYTVPAGLPTGAIHGDYFHDNVFFDGNKISGVFDFWFTCDELLIYGLAISLNVWGFENGTYKPDLFAAFLKGYMSVRPLSNAEKVTLPQELQRASIRFYLTRLYDQVMTTKNLENKPPKTWFTRFVFHKKREL